MTSRVLHRAGWLAVVGCCTALAASCSLFRTPVPANSATGRHATAPARLAQLDFGRDAVFAQCVPPPCPTRTPKTLASEAPRQPIDPAALRAPAEPVAPAPVPPSPATQAELSRTITVQFALGSAKLSPAARSRLDGSMGDLLQRAASPSLAAPIARGRWRSTRNSPWHAPSLFATIFAGRTRRWPPR